MTKRRLPSLGTAALILFGLFLFEYVLEHSLYLLTDAVLSGEVILDVGALSLLRLIVEYAVSFIEAVGLALSALIVLGAFTFGGYKSAFLYCLFTVLPRFIYLLPHYYMSIFSYGYDTIETFGILIPLSIFISVIIFIELIAILFLSLLPSYIKSRKSQSSLFDILSGALDSRALIDLGDDGVLASSIISLSSVALPLILAIINTVSVFSKYGFSLSANAILGIILEFLFVLLTFTVIHLLLSFIKRPLFAERQDYSAAHAECPSEPQGKEDISDAGVTDTAATSAEFEAEHKMTESDDKGSEHI